MSADTSPSHGYLALEGLSIGETFRGDPSVAVANAKKHSKTHNPEFFFALQRQKERIEERKRNGGGTYSEGFFFAYASQMEDYGGSGIPLFTPEDIDQFERELDSQSKSGDRLPTLETAKIELQETLGLETSHPFMTKLEEMMTLRARMRISRYTNPGFIQGALDFYCAMQIHMSLSPNAQ